MSDGALEILIVILIFNSFKTNMNLGIITSITTILSMITIHAYGKIYIKRDDTFNFINFSNGIKYKKN